MGVWGLWQTQQNLQGAHRHGCPVGESSVGHTGVSSVQRHSREEEQTIAIPLNTRTQPVHRQHQGTLMQDQWLTKLLTALRCRCGQAQWISIQKNMENKGRGPLGLGDGSTAAPKSNLRMLGPAVLGCPWKVCPRTQARLGDPELCALCSLGGAS